MLNQVTARLRKFIGKARKNHGLHAPFRVTTHRDTVQSFQSLELAIEADAYAGCLLNRWSAKTKRWASLAAPRPIASGLPTKLRPNYAQRQNSAFDLNQSLLHHSPS
jgi:hypothetical protein